MPRDGNPTRSLKNLLISCLVILSTQTAGAQQTPWRLASGTTGNSAGAFTFFRNSPSVSYALGDYWLMRSTDGGESWSEVHDNIWDVQGAILVHPTNSQVILSTKKGSGSWSDLFRSTDGGVTWTERLRGQSVPGTVLEPSPADPLTVWAGLGSRFFYRSRDFGEHWDTLQRPTGASFIITLSIFPPNPSIMYLGSYPSALKSTDRGENWVNITPSFLPPGGFLVRVHPWNDQIVYLGRQSHMGAPGGMFKSTDGGSSWVEINNGLTSGDWEIQRLLIHPLCPDTIYIALFNEDHVLFRSTNAGATWEPYDLGIPRSGWRSGIDGLAFDPDRQRLFVGGGTALQDSVGVYYLDLVTGVTPQLEDPPGQGGLLLYPNPSMGGLNVRFSLSRTESPSLTLFNTIGQQVGHFNLGATEGGMHTYSLSIGDLASGVYFLRLLTNSERMTARVILQR